MGPKGDPGKGGSSPNPPFSPTSNPPNPCLQCQVWQMSQSASLTGLVGFPNKMWQVCGSDRKTYYSNCSFYELVEKNSLTIPFFCSGCLGQTIPTESHTICTFIPMSVTVVKSTRNTRRLRNSWYWGGHHIQHGKPAGRADGVNVFWGRESVQGW